MRPKRVLLAVAFAAISCHHTTVSAHGSLHEQIVALTQDIAASGDNAASYLRRGELHRLHQDWAAAQADYDAASRLDPPGVEVHRCRAALWLDLGAAQRALESLDLFLSRAEDAETRLLRARAFRALGTTTAAIDDYDRAIASLAQPRPEHYLERARWISESGETEAALASLEAGIARLGAIVTLQLAKCDLGPQPHPAAHQFHHPSSWVTSTPSRHARHHAWPCHRRHRPCDHRMLRRRCCQFGRFGAISPDQTMRARAGDIRLTMTWPGRAVPEYWASASPILPPGFLRAIPATATRRSISAPRSS